MLGRGRTGSGKTYAFLLPMVARLSKSGRRAAPKSPRALILAPTRELVGQIEQALAPLAKAAGLTTQTVFGGVGQGPQVQGLRHGADIVLACPGRLEDLIRQRHCYARLRRGHRARRGRPHGRPRLPARREAASSTRRPADGQRMLFCGHAGQRAIDVLVKRYLDKPAVHQADSAQSPVAKMDHHVLHINREHRVPVLVDLASAPGRTIFFTRTKHGAKALARQLNKSGVPTVDLHGNLSQGARTRNMEAFHSGKATTLVATDIAARGIHVDDVALVVHADPPMEHKAYLHRSGRTARAGAAGTVITLMTDDQRRDVQQPHPGGGHQAADHPDRQRPSHPMLTTLAPGVRALPAASPRRPATAPAAGPPVAGRRSRWRRRRWRSFRNGRGGQGRRPARRPALRSAEGPRRAAAKPRRSLERRASRRRALRRRPQRRVASAPVAR